MSKKKRMPLGGLTVALLSASVVLLAGSTVGSARAALTYYSENYGAQDRGFQYRCQPGGK